MTKPDNAIRCTFTTTAGRRCRMLRTNRHVTLCPTHLEAQQRRLRSDPSSTVHDALTGVTDLHSATAIHHVLANLSALVTDNRISFEKAAVLAYMCQLLLQSAKMARLERWNDDPAPAGRPAPLLPPLLSAASTADTPKR